MLSKCRVLAINKKRTNLNRKLGKVLGCHSAVECLPRTNEARVPLPAPQQKTEGGGKNKGSQNLSNIQQEVKFKIKARATRLIIVTYNHN